MKILCKRQLDFEVFLSGVKKVFVLYLSSLWSLKELIPGSPNSPYHYPVVCVCFTPRPSASWIGLCGSTSSLLSLSGLAYFSTPLQCWLLKYLALFFRQRFKWFLLCVLLSSYFLLCFNEGQMVSQPWHHSWLFLIWQT